MREATAVVKETSSIDRMLGCAAGAAEPTMFGGGGGGLAVGAGADVVTGKLVGGAVAVGAVAVGALPGGKLVGVKSVVPAHIICQQLHKGDGKSYR